MEDSVPAPEVARVHSVDGNAFNANRRGKRLCAAFNKGKCIPSISGNLCPKDSYSVHQCTRCLDSSHGANTCYRTDYPAQKEAKPHSGKGGGKSKGKGGKGKSKGKWQY